MAEIAVRIRALSVTYGDVHALSGVDLEIEANAVTALIGPSGSGKSTLLYALAGRLPEEAATGGEIATREPLRRPPIVPQLPQTGRERVGAWIGGDLDALQAVGLPRGAAHARLRDLTVPERQLAALARVMAADTPLWLLDQPTSALDAQATARVEEVLWNARETRTVLLVTHDLAQARRASDSTALLMNGRIVEHAPTAELFVTPKDPRTAAFVEGRLIDA